MLRHNAYEVLKMEHEKILQAGKEAGLSHSQNIVFMMFFQQRFPQESNTFMGYVQEWAQRFKRGNPEEYMDTESVKIYNQVLVVYNE